MKKVLSVLTGGILFCVFCAGFAFAQPAGKAIVDNACTKCHNLKRVESALKNAAEWETTLDRMIKKGAKVKPEEREAVLKYLNGLSK